MKKLITLLATSVIAVGSFAQQFIDANLTEQYQNRPIISESVNDIRMPRGTEGTEALVSFLIDYDSIEVNSTGNLSEAFIWEINSNAECTVDTLVMSYFIMSFDTLIDAGTLLHYYSGNSTITIDTIFTLFGHENNSGTPDTIITSILLNNANGIPTGTVLWADTLISDTSLTAVAPDNTWLQAGVLISTPGITLNQGETFSVKIEYFAPRADTFGVLSFYYKDAGGDCDADCGSILPFMFPTSYYYINYPPNPALCDQFPDNLGNGLVVDCNADGIFGDFCENYYLNNHAIFAVVTIDTELFANATGDATICPGDNTQLEAIALGGSGNYTFEWMPTTGLSNPFSQTTNASPSVTTTYTVTIDDGNSTASATVLVDVKNVNVDLGTDSDIACGATTTVTPNLSGTTSGASFDWNNGASSFQLSNVGAGYYSVTVTNSFGCTATDDVTIGLQGINQSLSFTTPEPPNIACFNQAGTFTNTSTEVSGWNWEWDMGDGGLYFTANATHTYLSTGPKTVELVGTQISNPDCEITYTQNIVVTVCNQSIEETGSLANNMEIFPNPADGNFTLTVNGLSGSAVIEIFNINGELLLSETAEGTIINRAFNLDEFANGIYLMQVTDGNEVGVQRFVIAR
jgi:hypothetical protein